MYNCTVLCYKDKMTLMIKSMLTQLKVIEFLLTSTLKPIILLIIGLFVNEDYQRGNGC